MMILVALTFIILAYTHRNKESDTMMVIANCTGMTALILLVILLTVSVL